MSAPVVLAIAVTSLTLAVPVVVVSSTVATQQHLAGAADNAALAAADVLFGWHAGDACELAAQIAEASDVHLDSCVVSETRDSVVVSVSRATPLLRLAAISRAGQFVSYSDGA